MFLRSPFSSGLRQVAVGSDLGYTGAASTNALPVITRDPIPGRKGIVGGVNYRIWPAKSERDTCFAPGSQPQIVYRTLH
jgi:hypothetical protein